jgi:hypothetical protein
MCAARRCSRRYTRMVAKKPHMMDHLTINISG